MTLLNTFLSSLGVLARSEPLVTAGWPCVNGSLPPDSHRILRRLLHGKEQLTSTATPSLVVACHTLTTQCGACSRTPLWVETASRPSSTCCKNIPCTTNTGMTREQNWIRLSLQHISLPAIRARFIRLDLSELSTRYCPKRNGKLSDLLRGL